MLYFILRPLTRIALKAYFRRITINGLENLPLEKPVLICSNHPTGFIEPCLMACFLPRVFHFLVRGDLFEKPLLGKILKGTNQIPIYRFRDGYEKLRNNKEVMNISYDKLANGSAILIFPEASTKQVKHLRPIKKGAARMAMETLKLHPEIELSIVPIGINYSNPNKWRSYVTINIGEPVVPKLPVDEKKFPSEVLRLTRTLSNRLEKELLVLNEGVEEEQLDKVVGLGQWEMPVNSSIFVKYDEDEKFGQERMLSENLTSENAEVDLSEEEIGVNPRRQVKTLDYILFAILFLPVAFLLAVNAIPVFIGMYMRNKYVREIEFYGAVAIAASLGAYMILFPLALIFLLYLVGWWGLLIFLLPFGGLLGLLGYDYLKGIVESTRLNAKLGKDKKSQLLERGLAILETIRKK